MNVKQLWMLMSLNNKFKHVKWEDVMKKKSWKTITGSILFGLGFAVRLFAGIINEPSLEPIGEGLIGLGGMLGGIGVRDAIKKMKTENAAV